MAIQMRRGANSDFNPSKMLPGEIAVTTDGSRKVYAAFKANDVKELASKEDVQGLMNEFTSEVDREIAEAEQRIESKGQQVLDTIPDMYEEVSARADEAVRTKADAIVCSAKGVDILVEDSSNDYFRNLKLYGKTTQGENPSPNNPQPLESKGKWGNLFNHTATTQTVSAVTFTVNAYKSITANGKSTEVIALPIGEETVIPKGCKISGVTGGSNSTYVLRLFDYEVNGVVTDITSGSYTTTQEYKRGALFIRIASGVTLNNVTFYPMISEYDIPYRPYSGQMEIESEVLGGNLFDDETYSYVSKWEYPNETYCMVKLFVGIGKKATISFNDFTNNSQRIYLYVGNVFSPNNSSHISNPITMIAEDTILLKNATLEADADGYVYISCASGIGSTQRNEFVSTFFKDNFMVNYGTEVLPYIPYTKQSHISLVGDGLKGIPVTDASLATYTDENGQMWCSDDVDLERGVLVQRIKEINLEDFTWNYYAEYNMWISSSGIQDGLTQSLLCETVPNKPINTNNTVIGSTVNNVHNIWVRNGSTNITPSGKAQYILKTPIETPLSADEIASYKALHSNYKVTSVMNDCGAFMEVQYNADTKTYIDNKFAALAAQLV